MAKERMLTVLVPIKDSDATVVTTLPAITPDNINVIYKHEGVYKRLWLNPATNQYEYHEVIDREFPYIGKPLEIFDFTYDANRMSNAPTITAQGVMWFADKNADGNDVTLEDLWLARNNDCHVSFNGENFYLKQVPTCSKDNEDARYKYDIDFVSERIVLENVYIYDVVQPFVTERPISESSSFSFFGDVSELAKRINASLLRSGLATLELKNGISEGDILTYEEWNAIGLGTYDGPVEKTRKYIGGQGASPYRYFYPYYDGDYNAYLRGEIYASIDGEFVQHGYVCMIGKDKKGELTTSEEKLITFDNNTIHEALQQVHDTFELQYYITREKDSNGDFTGNTVIMIADCEHDFADVTGTDADGNPSYSRDADGIPTTEHPFDYGVDDELLAKEKRNTTDKIVTRITGVGSNENIPWYYPNPTADGWIKPVYKTGGVVQDIEVGYPLTEGSTTEENVRYEKYLKNRIGDVFQYGIVKETVYKTQYKAASGIGYYTDNTGQRFVQLIYPINTKQGYSAPWFTININFGAGSNAGRVRAKLHDNTSNIDVDSYDSNESYTNPSNFQRAFIQGDSSIATSVDINHIYYLYITIDIVGGMPVSQKYDSVGHLYNGRDAGYTTEYNQYYPSLSPTSRYVHIRQDFYSEEGLLEVGELFTVYYTNNQHNIVIGYSTNGSPDTSATPFARIIGRQYKDINTGEIYKCTSSSEKTLSAYSANPEAGFEEWVSRFLNFTINIIDADGWYKNKKKVSLSDYAIVIDVQSPSVLDTIEFQRVKYVTPQPNLMPEVYIKTDGERRFYNAVNYPLASGTPDTMIGEQESEGQIINPLYYKEGSSTHFDFENEYIQLRPHEHIENFDDVKPTIKGQIGYFHVSVMPDDWAATYRNYYRKSIDGNYVANRSPIWSDTTIYVSGRIDVVEEFAYDELDNDEVWESNDDGNVSGEYKHPYFFAKLRPLGFNLFDLALQDDMVLSMTTGHCGACNFKIGVDENTKKNPVQIWEYDVYEGANYATKTFKYAAGALRRVVDTSNLYYDKTPGDSSGYVLVDAASNRRLGFLVADSDISLSRSAMFERRTYSAQEVVNGEVGALKKDNKNHFAGDVVTNGKLIASQQDTSENYVWVALMKDTDTYGVLMPSARPDYADGNFNVYIRPKSVADTSDEDTADKFVLTNIRMPQVYLRRAEKELSKRLIAYMYDNNYQKFNFSIKFSRIFLAQNPSIDADLNENSVLYVSFNNRTYRQYVKHYTYRMAKDAALPEISVDMNEELSVSRTQVERESIARLRSETSGVRRLQAAISRTESRIGRQTIGRNEDVIVNGNLVSRGAVTSFGELQDARRITEVNLSDTIVDLEVNHFRKSDFVTENNKVSIGDSITMPTKTVFDSFVGSVNNFNKSVASRMMQVRYTMEDRFNLIQNGTCSTIDIDRKQRVYDLKNDEGVAFWKDSGGSDVSTTSVCPSPFIVTWTNFNPNN